MLKPEVSGPAQSSRSDLRVRQLRTPLGRIGTADEIAAAICFLAGPDSRWTTGVILSIDGGASAM